MEPEALVSLVVFTGVVSVYRLGRAGVAVADVFPGDETLADEVLEKGCDRLFLCGVFSRTCFMLSEGPSKHTAGVSTARTPRPYRERKNGGAFFARG